MTGKMARLQVGSQIDHFTLKELLGQGGFGTVYRAVETETGRECAVKFLRRGPPDQYDRADRQSRFEREANILMALKHPSIPRAFGCNLQRAPIYVAQEFIRGTTLEHEIYERVKAGRHKFTLEEAVQLLSKIARAVHYANEMGVVHRDLKPANVMLVSNKKDRVKVLDFGIAKIMTSDSSKGTTQGRVLGTVSVMSAGHRSTRRCFRARSPHVRDFDAAAMLGACRRWVSVAIRRISGRRAERIRPNHAANLHERRAAKDHRLS
jgi:serine/threonine protein kinase